MKQQYKYSLLFPGKTAFSLIIVFLLLTGGSAIAQPPIEEDPDGWYFRARELAFEGEYEQARDICRQILELYPHYHDVKILKARTYSWDGEFIRANDLLREVLQEDPDYRDALFALIDLQIWYEDYEEALIYLDIALAEDPNNLHLLYRKALALKETGDELAAVVLINQILDMDPTHEEAKDLRETIQVNRLVNQVGIGYQGSYFLENTLDMDPNWHLFYAEVGRRTNALGLVNFRANYAHRFETNSLQLEVEAYPTVRPGTYLYMNVGYSQDRRLFPITRFGFEVYQNLPLSYELSAGFRILNFDETESLIVTKDLLIVTGSLSKYIQNYYFSFRPYFTYSSVGADPNSRSFFFTARRFFSSTEHHLSLTLGRGFSVDYDQLVGGQIYDLSGTQMEARLLYQQRVTPRFLFKLGAGYKLYDENIFDDGIPYGNPLLVEGGLMYRF